MSSVVDELLESLRELKELAEHGGGEHLEVGLFLRPAEAGVRALPPKSPALSPRETQVLQCVADGMSDRAIGLELAVSIETVRTHVRRLRRKLGASNRATAVAQGLRRGIIS
jgi:DNA-binding CsgD family transcriptional regulator